MRAVWGCVCFLCIALIITLIVVFFFRVKWPVENAVNAPLNKAQVAAEAEDMLDWLLKVQTGMQEWGMTRGYATIFKHTYDYDYEAIYKSLENLIGRLERTREMDKTSQEYQMAMNDHRGNARELDLRIGEYLFKHYGWWMVLLGIALFLPTCLAGGYAIDGGAGMAAGFGLFFFLAFVASAIVIGGRLEA